MIKSSFFKRIFHIGAWNRNIGDWAAGYNLHRMLEEQAHKRKIALDFYLIDSQRSLFHNELIEQINDEADLLLIGGGGMIFNRPLDLSASGWAFNITVDRLKEITVPIVVYAIGYNKFYFDKNKWPAYIGDHLKVLQNKANIFSVRNEGSRKKLNEEFGLNYENIEIVPDAGMHLYDRYIRIPNLDRDKSIIGLNWAGDRPEERFQEPWQENRDYFITELCHALNKMIKKYNVQILYIPHLADVDVDFITELEKNLPHDSILDLRKALPHLYPPAGEMLYHHVPFFTNIYRQVDLTVGMRGHSCIFSFGATTKFIPLGSHNKLIYFAQDVGVPDYEVRMINRQKENRESMFNTIAAALQDNAYKESLSELLQSEKEKSINVNERILDLLG